MGEPANIQRGWDSDHDATVASLFEQTSGALITLNFNISMLGDDQGNTRSKL